MAEAPFIVEPLATAHDRKAFTCGVAALDHYFQTQARQDMRRCVAACFVARERAQGAIAGFYTLAATSLLLTDLPDDTARKLPRYPAVPAILLGRLAVASSHQAQKLGAALLADALERAARTEIGAFALIVDAKDDNAIRFYQHHGFTPLPDDPHRLFLPLATAFNP